jgi:hypothetical protein
MIDMKYFEIISYRLSLTLTSKTELALRVKCQRIAKGSDSHRLEQIAVEREHSEKAGIKSIEEGN